MSSSTLFLNNNLYQYLLENSLREPAVLQRLREETAADPMAAMQISPEQGHLMSLLVGLMRARNTLEIGVFTGYSALWTALALPAEGRMIACDVSPDWTRVARRYWAEAGVADRIELRLQPALETLDELLAGGEAGGFDFAFIDADKANYLNYYERCLELVRPGGLIAVDNMFWDGAVVDPAVDDADTRAIRALARHAKEDQRVDISLVPIGDGLLLARKK